MLRLSTLCADEPDPANSDERRRHAVTAPAQWIEERLGESVEGGCNGFVGEVAQTPIGLRDVEGDAGDVCRMILDLLPPWFGIPEATDAYVQTAGTHPSVIASINGDDVGITTVKHHSPYAAEVYLMAIKPSFHRAGIGTAMLRHLEDMLAAQGVEFLQVKTLSAARPDLDYDKTRAFYLAYGFRPLEEFTTLWDPSNN